MALPHTEVFGPSGWDQSAPLYFTAKCSLGLMLAPFTVAKRPLTEPRHSWTLGCCKCVRKISSSVESVGGSDVRWHDKCLIGMEFPQRRAAVIVLHFHADFECGPDGCAPSILRGCHTTSSLSITPSEAGPAHFSICWRNPGPGSPKG